MALHAASTSHRWPRLTTAAAVGSLLLASAALAQGRRMMVVDEGAGPNYFHVSMPDLRVLREPDFVRGDLPVFATKLHLDEPQRERVSTLLDGYLDAFALLATEYLPANGPLHLAMGEHGEHDRDHAAHDAGAGVFVHDLTGGEGGPEAWLHEEGQGMVAITVEAGGPGFGGGGGATEDIDVGIEAGPDGQPQASVRIAVQGRDGEELPEEVREELEKRAQEIAEKLQAQMEKAEEEGDGLAGLAAPQERIETRMRELEEFAARAGEFEDEKRHLRTRFVESVQAGLTDDQMERWPALERTLVREKTLPKGRLDGERTDLVQVLEDVASATLATPAVAEQLDAYELVLHDALVRRNAFVEEANQKVDEAVKKGEAEKALPVIDRATQLRVAVREINETYTEAIAQELDATTADAFRQAVLERSYPRVYRTPRGLRIFEAARQLEGLEEDRLLRILELEGQYRHELAVVNEQLRRAIDTWEPDRARRSMESVVQASSGEAVFLDMTADGGNPVREAADKRAALGRRYVASLHDLLTPEQVAELPKMPKHQSGPVLIEHSTIK